MIDQTQRAWCHAVSHMFPSEAEPCFETPELLEKLGYIAEYEGRTKNRELEQLIKKRIADFEKEHGEIPLSR